MKKVRNDELRREYHREDLGKGIRGKHINAFREGTNLVLLRPEVAASFPTEEAVNDALSSLIEVAEHTANQKKPSRRRTAKSQSRSKNTL